MEVLQFVTGMLEAGLPAVMLVMLVVVWRVYLREVESHIADIKEAYKGEIADLRTRVALLEDHEGMKLLKRQRDETAD